MEEEQISYYVEELLSGEEVRFYEREHEIQFEEHLKIIGENYGISKNYEFDCAVFLADR